ncbi:MULTISPECIES: glycosyltransferase [Candidatus Nitrosocaldus]|jgi:glycosyltransferase involved in cell wall biosynthesis|uniref:Putative glycosyl transferase family protein n=1 Tax=Candidatus Nitrosocaldus cavascurensis TaxID=2058097 RepID=A0A2K5AS65_9ARCH|nr:MULTISPECIES: glycosyltransferase family 2 protein [Candidatus Nitrosocaldus]SPC34444.1 putative glycosyl transferase family protein [Candidatus Nitrosocaldus cavascurensis]
MRISIGIPTYNEQDSILALLKALEMQHLNGYEIAEVIVSDDSSDATPTIVKDFASKSMLSIVLLHHDERRGAASAWNEIFANASSKSDVIVLYDADVIPARDATMLLASSMEDEHVGLTAANPMPAYNSKMRSYGQRIAAKASVFNSSWLRRVRLLGINQYIAMGRAMAVRSSIAKATRIPSSTIAIDLYMQCITLEMGYEVRYRDDAIVWFKPVESIEEFISQVRRAVVGHRELAHLIDRLNIRLPLKSMVVEGLKASKDDPLGLLMLALAYMLYPFYMKPIDSRWSVARSSKGLSLNDVEGYIDNK